MEGHFNISITKRVSLENSTDLGRGAAPELKSVEFLSETLLVVEQIDIHTHFTARQMLYLYRSASPGSTRFSSSSLAQSKVCLTKTRQDTPIETLSQSVTLGSINYNPAARSSTAAASFCPSLTASP